MKSNQLFRIALLLITSFLYYECVPTDPIPELIPPEIYIPPGTENPTNGNITSEKTTLKTYEFGIIKTSSNVSQSYEGKLGNKDVKLFAVADKQLSFYVPNLPEGTYLLKFELGEINFNITPSTDVDPSSIFKQLEDSFPETSLNTNELTSEDVQNVSTFKVNITNLFNSLTEDQRIEAAHFYDANKLEFENFSSNVFNVLNAPTNYHSQTNCPDNDALSFYSCTASNLTSTINSYKILALKNSQLLNYLKIMNAGVELNTSSGGPAEWLSIADGYSVAFGTAIYLLQFKSLPATIHLKKADFNFLTTPWILNEDVFENVTTEFYSNQLTDLNLKTYLRTLKNSDVNLSSDIRAYIDLMNSLNPNDFPFSNLFYPLASYSDKTELIALDPSEISISGYSGGGYIDLISFDGKKVNFKTDIYVSDLQFNFDVKIEKNGFSRFKSSIYSVLKNECELNIGSQAPEIKNIEITCRPDSEGYFSLLVDFEATEPGILLYSFGTNSVCSGNNETDNILCNPLKISYQINGYWEYYTFQNYAGYKIISGNSKKGILRIDLAAIKPGCNGGTNPAESFLQANPTITAIKVGLINKCGQQTSKILEL